MNKIYIVKSCNNCPAMHHTPIQGERWCGAPGFGRKIEAPVSTFPDWCPLEDEPGSIECEPNDHVMIGLHGHPAAYECTICKTVVKAEKEIHTTGKITNEIL